MRASRNVRRDSGKRLPISSLPCLLPRQFWPRSCFGMSANFRRFLRSTRAGEEKFGLPEKLRPERLKSVVIERNKDGRGNR